jgi:hypothetical protein
MIFLRRRSLGLQPNFFAQDFDLRGTKTGSYSATIAIGQFVLGSEPCLRLRDGDLTILYVEIPRRCVGVTFVNLPRLQSICVTV